MTNEDLDKLLEFEKQATDQDIVNQEWGYYEANKDDIGPGSFAYVLYRDGFYQTKARHYYYAAAAMNALPKLIAEIKASRHVLDLARKLQGQIGMAQFSIGNFEKFKTALHEFDEAWK
jgi:hypothetical protein